VLHLEILIASFSQIHPYLLCIFAFFFILSLSPSAEYNARKAEFVSFLARKETSQESLTCLQTQMTLIYWGSDK